MNFEFLSWKLRGLDNTGAFPTSTIKPKQFLLIFLHIPRNSRASSDFGCERCCNIYNNGVVFSTATTTGNPRIAIIALRLQYVRSRKTKTVFFVLVLCLPFVTFLYHIYWQ